METILRASGWELVYSDTFISPPSSFEIWEKQGASYQIRFSWPRGGDCNGATTIESEIDKAMKIMGLEENQNE